MTAKMNQPESLTQEAREVMLKLDSAHNMHISTLKLMRAVYAMEALGMKTPPVAKDMLQGRKLKYEKKWEALAHVVSRVDAMLAGGEIHSVYTRHAATIQTMHTLHVQGSLGIQISPRVMDILQKREMYLTRDWGRLMSPVKESLKPKPAISCECAHCGKTYSPAEHSGKHGGEKAFCPSCREWASKTALSRMCRVCHKPYAITHGERELLLKSGKPLPVRCPHCIRNNYRTMADVPLEPLFAELV